MVTRDPGPAAGDLVAQTQQWHEARLARLQAEDGWLTLVGLHWLEEGDSVAGSAPEAAVGLPAPAPARLGTFHRQGLAVGFTPAHGVEVALGGRPFAGGPVRTDRGGPADVLRHGSLQLLAIVRGGRVGLRVRDAQAPARRGFRGIERFAVRADWRKEARLEPAPDGRTVAIPSVLGEVEEVALAGSAVFTHEGREYRLDATREGERLLIVFGDPTNGAETYGAGRFLYAEAPREGRVVLDFNRALNPPCAFTPYATCPLPPRQNRLPLRVEAGEQRPGGHP